MRFARVGWRRVGYSIQHVDAWFTSVAEALDQSDGMPALTPDDVRKVRFPMLRNGYDYRQVDAALDRMELQIVERQRAAASGMFSRVADDDADEEVEDLLRQLHAPKGERFLRCARLQRGYAVGQVDSFCERLEATLTGGRGPGLRAVRQVEFHAQLGGYAEDDVDELLDRVVDVLLRRLVRP